MIKFLDESTFVASYARAYYSPGTDTSTQCKTYLVPQIAYTAYSNASCPFPPRAWLGFDTSSYQMDTGPLDSHDILGLNALSFERVSVRKRTNLCFLTSRAVY